MKGKKKWLIAALIVVAALGQAGVLPPVVAPIADALRPLVVPLDAV